MTESTDLQLWEESGGLCALSGMPIKLGMNASIDRVDSMKSYEEGNLQFVHKDVNIMKNKYDQDYFIEVCKLIANNHEKGKTE